jgi:hypothetical protein
MRAAHQVVLDVSCIPRDKTCVPGIGCAVISVLMLKYGTTYCKFKDIGTVSLKVFCLDHIVFVTCFAEVLELGSELHTVCMTSSRASGLRFS